MLKIFKNKYFNLWASKAGLSDEMLAFAALEMNKGLYEANLGGYVYKKRIALGNRGKREGIRTLIAFKAGHRCFFIYGFSKNKKSNITQVEKEALKNLAKLYFSYDEKQLNNAVYAGELVEIK